MYDTGARASKPWNAGRKVGAKRAVKPRQVRLSGFGWTRQSRQSADAARRVNDDLRDRTADLLTTFAGVRNVHSLGVIAQLSLVRRTAIHGQLGPSQRRRDTPRVSRLMLSGQLAELGP